MSVGGAGPIWWFVGSLLPISGVMGGFVWMAFNPVVVRPGMEEYRGALTLVGYVFWGLSFTFLLLWIYTAVALYHFGLWPRSPERTRGFPVEMNGPADPPLTNY